MTERKDTLSPDNWLQVKQIPPIGYFAGFDYRGNYAGRLNVNLGLLEQICREAWLPPLVFKSEVWNPPAVKAPQVVAPGLSAFRKSALVPQGSVVLDEPRKPLALETSGNTYSGIPVGWDIRIKDAMLMHRFESSHPRASTADKERYFERELNRLVRSALAKVGRAESGLTRLQVSDPNTRLGVLGFKLAAQAIALGGGGLELTSHPDSAAFWTITIAAVGITIGVQMMTESVMDAFLILSSDNTDPMFTPDTATRSWRKKVFLQRYMQEEPFDRGFTPFDTPFKMVAFLGQYAKPLAIPTGLALERYYRTKLALAKYPGPLFKLA